MSDDGMRARREVLGDEHVDRSIDATTGLDADFQRWLTDAAWGGLWTRTEQLDRHGRSSVLSAAIDSQRSIPPDRTTHRSAHRRGLPVGKVNLPQQ
jgi:hypothetical protein